jgi:DNA-binding transcriptional MerR regulator
MKLKMKALMEASGESKSTILYYLKEGLLPQPSKPKPNVHLYDEACVEILKFIKYLKQNFSYSIAEIKEIFANNRFDFDDSFEMMVRSLEIISGGKERQWYTKEAFCDLLGVDEATLTRYKTQGYLFEQANGFSSKEVEIAQILIKLEKLGFDCTLLDHYVAHAKVLATQENEAGAKLLRDHSLPHDSRYELLFDLILTLKPYLFNMHTVQAHQNRINQRSHDETSL